MRVAIDLLLAASAVLALLTAYHGSEGGARRSLAALVLCIAAICALSGLSALAVAFAAFGVTRFFAPALQRGDAPRKRLREQLLPIVIAAAFGLAAPILLDAAINTRRLPPPIEGVSAARAGYGLYFAVFERGLLLSASVLALAMLAVTLRRLVATPSSLASDEEGAADATPEEPVPGEGA